MNRNREGRHVPHAHTHDLVSELQFWIRIMGEHALFIKLGLPADKPGLIAEADAFMRLFQNLGCRLQASRCALEPTLLREIADAVCRLIEFKRGLIRMAVMCSLGGSNYPLLLDHITREALRFLEILNSAMRPGPCESPLQGLLQTEVFWIRQMKEHVEFIIHYLDPSERGLIGQAEGFRVTFAGLLQTAQDLASMAEARPQCFNTAIRFTRDAIGRTTELRDFKAAGTLLVERCEVLSIISTPILVDHLRREADKFLDEMNDLLMAITGMAGN